MSEAAFLPALAPGARIGLLGGSFNPPHAAHRLASLYALKRLNLDAVWWLVSPGNPLKEQTELAPLAERVNAARRLAHHPRIRITTLEAAIGTRYTVDTVAFLRKRYPAVQFVWLMGADNLAQFHRWRRWRRIAALVPIAIIDRPGSSLQALGSPAALTLARRRLREETASSLAAQKPPAWVFLHGLKSPLSSTDIRRQIGAAAAR